MFVHVDAQVFERRPLLGVALGAVGLCLALFGIWFMLEQSRMFGKEPQVVEVDQAVPPPPHFDIGTWVHLRGALQMRCGEVVQWRRNPPESWIFGKIESTYIPASNVSGDRFFLLQFDKDVNCQTMPKGPLIGVLTPVNSRLKATLSDAGLNFPRTKIPPMLFEIGWGPARTRSYLCFFVLFACMCLWMMKRYWRKHELAKNPERTFAAAAGRIG